MPTFEQKAQDLAAKIQTLWTGQQGQGFVLDWIKAHADQAAPNIAFLQAAGQYMGSALGVVLTTPQDTALFNRAIAIYNPSSRLVELYSKVYGFYDRNLRPPPPPVVVAAPPPPPPAPPLQPSKPPGPMPAPAETTPPARSTPDPGQKIPNDPPGPAGQSVRSIEEWIQYNEPRFLSALMAAARAGNFGMVQNISRQLRDSLASYGISSSAQTEYIVHIQRRLAGMVEDAQEPAPPPNYPEPEHVPGPAPPPTPEVAGDPPGETPPTAPPTQTQTVWMGGLEGYVTLDQARAGDQGNRIMQYKIISQLKAAGKVQEAKIFAKRWGQDFGILTDSKTGVQPEPEDAALAPVPEGAGFKSIAAVIGLLLFGKVI